MFGRKIKCICGKKIDKSYTFCPYCGRNLKHIDEEKSALKKQQKLRRKEMNKQIDNLTKELSESFGIPFINSFPFKLFVKKISNDIEKQFREMDMEMSRAFKMHELKIPEGAKETKKEIIHEGKKIGNVKEFTFPGGHGFSIQINLSGTPNALTLETENDNEEKKEREKSKKGERKITEKEAKRLAALPRQEPETKVRRLSDKVIYEISLPGVKNQKDVIINKLQNSIEIKAFTKDKAYFKLIPLGLPIKNYKLVDEKLILELKP